MAESQVTRLIEDGWKAMRDEKQLLGRLPPGVSTHLKRVGPGVHTSLALVAPLVWSRRGLAR